jgi:predicted TIM-barrel fold metal-dependent hydrolase
MGGYFHVPEAIRMAERHPNLYLETSATPYPELIRQAVEAVGPDRVLFASDGPGCDPRLEVHKVKLAGLRPEDERKVLGESFLALLGERPGEAA